MIAPLLTETEDCFEDLPLINGDEVYQLKRDHSEKGIMTMSVKLPPNKTCKACIIRWDYRAANNWGRCPDGKQRTGCGLQELYRNCADISIRTDGFGIGLGGGPNTDDSDEQTDDRDNAGSSNLWRRKLIIRNDINGLGRL